MTSIGNERANLIYGGYGGYGGNDPRPNNNATDEVWRKFIIDKYFHKNYIGKTNSTYNRTQSASCDQIPLSALKIKPDQRNSKCRRPKPSARSTATRMSSSNDNVPVGNLLDFDSERISNKNASTSNTKTRKDPKQLFNEAAPDTDNFFTQFGV